MIADFVNAGLIPERVDTGFLGFTVDRRTIINKFLEFIQNASDQQIRRAVSLVEKRFK